MPKLPGVEELGRAPSGRSGKPIASYDTSAIGRGVANLGAGIQSAAQDLSVAAKTQKTTVDKALAFETERRHLEFVAEQEKKLQDLGQKATPGAFGFTEAYGEEYLNAAKEFYSSVPEELKPEYDVKLFRAEDGLRGRANTFERDQRKNYYSTQVSEGLTSIEDKLYKNPKAFDENLAEGNKFIDLIPDEDVGPIAKDALRKEWKKKAQLAALNGLPDSERLKVLGEGETVDIAAVGSAHEGAKALLRSKEGFRAEPYWDVNAYRIGYGSDTITKSDGSVVKVRPGMTVTRADAERDIERRVAEFERIAINQVGRREWGALPEPAKAALLSTTYNYGELPGSVVNSVKSGNIESIAASVEGLQNHNAGVNRKRRLHEAAMIRGGGSMQGFAPSDVDPRFADMTYAERETIVAATRKDMAAAATADAARQKADYTLRDDALALDIELGKVVSEQQIINDPTLNDGDIVKHLKAFRAKQEKDGDVRDLVASIIGGDAEGAAVNGFDAEERKTGDKAYKAMLDAAPDREPVVTEAFVKSTGYIPKSVQSQLRQGAASKDAAELSATLSRADALERAAPISFGAFDGGGDARDKLALFRHYINDMGLAGEDAAQRILAMNDPATKVNREVLKPDVPKFLKTLTIGEVTDAFDPGVFQSEPGAGVMPIQANGLLAEYRELAEAKYYETGGDAGAAKALALADIKKRWNVSGISGSANLMRLPPELYYPPVDGGHDYLRKDAMETAESYVKDQFPGRKVENVAILAGDMTRADIEMGRPPRYRLFYQYTEDGQSRFDEVLGGAWGLDPAAVNEQAMSARQKAKKAFEFERDADSQANDIRRQSQDEADKILADPYQPDWLKAMRAQSALTLGEMNAADRKAEKAPEEPETRSVPAPASDDFMQKLFEGAMP